MKKIDGYWVDDNGNQWSDRFSEQEAEEASRSLANCVRCQDCQNCEDCRHCQNCEDCRHCQYCEDCQYCRHCQYCEDCQYCRDCQCCEDCRHCEDCEDCRHCEDCQKCKEYTNSPAMYRTAEIGSRKAQTLFCYGKTSNGTSLQIVCGCFRGNLEEFEKKVLETHENNEVYRNQYLEEIRKVKVLFGLEEREVAHEDMEIE